MSYHVCFYPPICWKLSDSSTHCGRWSHFWSLCPHQTIFLPSVTDFYDIRCSIFGLCCHFFGFSILLWCWLLHNQWFMIKDKTFLLFLVQHIYATQTNPKKRKDTFPACPSWFVTVTACLLIWISFTFFWRILLPASSTWPKYRFLIIRSC